MNPIIKDMKKIVVILFSCLEFMVVNAQELNNVNSMLENFRLSMLPDVRDLDSPTFTEKYAGSPFLYPEWHRGTIALHTGKSYEFPMKYLVHGDLILIKSEKDSINKLNLSNQILNIKMNGQTFVYLSYSWNNKIKNGLMEVLYENKSRLLKLYTCRIEKGAEVSGYQEKEKDKFVIKETLFCQLNEGNPILLPRSKKELFSLFVDRSSEMEKFFKEQKLKLKDDKDLVKLFIYYDSF